MDQLASKTCPKSWKLVKFEVNSAENKTTFEGPNLLLKHNIEQSKCTILYQNEVVKMVEYQNKHEDSHPKYRLSPTCYCITEIETNTLCTLTFHRESDCQIFENILTNVDFASPQDSTISISENDSNSGNNTFELSSLASDTAILSVSNDAGEGCTTQSTSSERLFESSYSSLYSDFFMDPMSSISGGHSPISVDNCKNVEDILYAERLLNNPSKLKEHLIKVMSDQRFIDLTISVMNSETSSLKTLFKNLARRINQTENKQTAPNIQVLKIISSIQPLESSSNHNISTKSQDVAPPLVQRKSTKRTRESCDSSKMYETVEKKFKG